MKKKKYIYIFTIWLPWTIYYFNFFIELDSIMESGSTQWKQVISTQILYVGTE